ncbi:MAG: SDR family oxidoreductase [Ruminococcaceae bacterium]|nr:SDR family oxidoreductase [Oscillospiraceae bacterium]
MDKKVLITGGSRGIGAACVRKFTECGDKVVFIYRSREEDAKKISEETGAFAIRADLSSPKECIEAVKKVAELMGGIDVLVNNAGIAQFSLFTDITEEDWNRMLAVNLSAPFYLSREAAKLMISEKSGRIINISSMWGITGASCEVHYSAAKAGLIGMTKALSKELGPSGITVNCIAPGVIETEMNAHLKDEDIDALKEATPLCRLGTPDDVASLALYLASDVASFITGQIIAADGGFAV